MTITETDRISRDRKRHHDALELLAQNVSGKTEVEPGLKLWRKLRKIEAIAHRIATAHCNGERATYHLAGMIAEYYPSNENSWEVFADAVCQEIENILGAVPPGFFVNGDARGYALKIEPPITGVDLHQDWGRNQILAPEIN